MRLADAPVPACPPGGVLVRTRCSVVSSGTERQVLDLARKSLAGKAKARPDLVRQVLGKARTEGVAATVEKVRAKLDEVVPLGYSAAGEVIEAGAEAGGLRPGDRVAAAGAGHAGHAEFNAVPRNLCARIPADVPYADAAFATLGAIAMQGVRQAEPRIGERVAVIGLGLIGLLTAQILKANGCAVLGVDPDGERAELARRLGVDVAVAEDGVAACEALTGGRGADAVIVAAATPSAEPVSTAAEMSRRGGRVVVVGLVGLNVPREPFYLKELDLRLSTSAGPGRYDPVYEEQGHDYPFAHVRFTEQRNMESFLYLVEQGKVTPAALVTHRLPIADALDAYALLDGKQPRGRSEGRSPRALGILLEYPDDAALERTVSLDRESGSRRFAPDAGGDAGAPSVCRGARSDRLLAGGDLRVGIFGAGRFARGVLLPRLAKKRGVRLAAVCTRSGRTARDAAERFGAPLATTDPERLLADRDVDAVVVATNHASHAELAVAALRAGKHAFVEKPLCLSEAELGEIEQALADARAAGFRPCLTVGFNRRFSPHARALRACLSSPGSGDAGPTKRPVSLAASGGSGPEGPRTDNGSGALRQEPPGRGAGLPRFVTYRVNAGSVPAGSWLADPREGGRIVGEACHFVDFCGALIDDDPVEVTAAGIASAGPDDPAGDAAVLTVRYAGGSLATIQYVTVGHPGLAKERCEASSGGRTAVLDDFRVTKCRGGGPNLRGRQAKGHAEALAAFVDACRDGGPWPIPWRSLAATHRVCFAAVGSLRTGRPVAVEAPS